MGQYLRKLVVVGVVTAAAAGGVAASAGAASGATAGIYSYAACVSAGNAGVVNSVVEDEELNPSQCWCCGAIDDPERMVYLGNHPEVALCVRCARWAAKEAREIEDRDKTGTLVHLRDRFRATRRGVVERGWHNSRWFGGPIRWLGKHLP